MSNFSALKTAIQSAIKQNGNNEITGDILQDILLSIVSTLGDSAINTLEQGLQTESQTRGNDDAALSQAIEHEATARVNQDTQLGNLITGIKNNIDNGYVYAGIATPSTTPVSGKVFYIATQAGTYTNLGNTAVKPGISILKYNGSAWSNEQVIYTDGGVFDVSAYNGGATYASLEALLSDANLLTIIPPAVRKGGMSIKFVSSVDNKYVQYRLMSDTFNTTESDWQGVDDKPTAGSDNLVKSGGTAKELSDIDTILTLSTNNPLIKLESNKYIDLSGSSVIMNDGKPQYSGASSTFSCGMMQCSEGDIFVISGTGGSIARLWGFIGNDGSILFVSNANNTNSSLILSAPANAAWIIINTNSNEASYKNILLSSLLSQLRTSTERITNSYMIDFVYETYIDTNVSVGSTVSLTRTQHNLFRSAIVNCVEGDIFCINAKGGTDPKTIAFIDSENKLIQNDGSAMYNEIVIAPANSAKAIINDNTTGWTGKCYHGYLPKQLNDIKTITNELLSKSVMVGANVTSTSILSDADDAALNRIYLLSVSIDNTPENYGSLITLGMSTNYCLQLYGSPDNSLYYRMKWLTWKPWMKLNTNNEYFDFSLIRKFGVIGDSFASGEVFWRDTNNQWQSADKYSISWGQILARNHGNICTNYSKGGLTTRSWLTSDKGLSLLLANEPEDMYLLILGINDYYSLGQSYLGTLTDITSHESYQDYGDTFYGNYGRIIEQVQGHAPYSKLIMFTIVNNETVPAMFTDAIIEIANYYNIPYIVQRDDDFFTSTIYTDRVQGHPRATGYVGMASAFDRLITKCVNSHYSYFKDIYMNDGD